MFADIDPPLRILYHHRIAAADGMRVHITEVVNALRERGHDVLVVGPTAADGEARAGGRSRVEEIAEKLRRLLPAAAYEALELAYNLPAYLRLSAAARRFRPDILYERYNLFLLAGLALKKRLGLPMLLEINSPLAAERAEFGNLQLSQIASRCEAALWRGADAALPVTEVLSAHVRKIRGADGVHVIPNGAKLELCADPEARMISRRRLGIAPDALVLGFVGFVRAWHGVGWAIDALPDLPLTAHLVVVGDGPALDQLRTRAAELGVSDRVHLVGRVPHSEVGTFMQSFDIALQTASVAYASPLKLLEYMALGRAIIAPDQPNIRELLQDRENALLFQPGSEDAFRDALHTLCEDPELRSRLGGNALRAVEETPLTWAHNARRIERLGAGLSQDRKA